MAQKGFKDLFVSTNNHFENNAAQLLTNEVQHDTECVVSTVQDYKRDNFSCSASSTSYELHHRIRLPPALRFVTEKSVSCCQLSMMTDILLEWTDRIRTWRRLKRVSVSL